MLSDLAGEFLDARPASEMGSASASNMSGSNPVVWKKPSPPQMELEVISAADAHMKSRPNDNNNNNNNNGDDEEERVDHEPVDTTPKPFLQDPDMDADARSPPVVLHGGSLASSRQPSPSVAAGAHKRPSMHYRPVDMRDVFNVIQEEDDEAVVEMAAPRRSGSCMYVVPGLYEEICRQYEDASPDAAAEMSGRDGVQGYATPFGTSPTHAEAAKVAEVVEVEVEVEVVMVAEATAPLEEADAVPETTDAVEPADGHESCDDGASEECIAPAEALDGAAEDLADAEGASFTADLGGREPAGHVDVYMRAGDELDELTETLALKELVARDALEAMAQAEVETVLLIAMQMRGPAHAMAAPATVDETPNVPVDSTHDTPDEAAPEVDSATLCNAAKDNESVTVEDVHHEEEADPAPVTEEEQQHQAEVVARFTPRTPHTPRTPQSTRSSPRAVSSPRAAADAIVAAPVTEAVVAGRVQGTESEPSASADVTPAKRCASALATTAATVPAVTRPLLPAVKRGPAARVEPFNAFLESVKRARQAPTRPAEPRLPSLSSRPRALGEQMPQTTTGQVTALPHVGRGQTLHLIDQRRFYERGGQYNYSALYKQQTKRQTLMQLAAPLPNEIES